MLAFWSFFGRNNYQTTNIKPDGGYRLVTIVRFCIICSVLSNESPRKLIGGVALLYFHKMMVKLEITRACMLIPRPRSSKSISCSNYLVICELYMTNKFVLQRRKRVYFELEIWQDNSYRTKPLSHRVKFRKNNVPGRVLPIQN